MNNNPLKLAAKHDNMMNRVRVQEKNIQMTGNGDLRLNWDLWNEKGMKEICPLIDQCTIQNELYLNDNKDSQILNQIHQIKFPNLKVLNINDNNIFSIEILCRIYFPKLEKLYLFNNHINFITCLRKINANLLTTISFESNPITDITHILKLSLLQLSQIYLQSNPTDQIVENDFRWLFKMSDKITLFFLTGIKRIQRMGCYQMFDKKWKNCMIMYK